MSSRIFSGSRCIKRVISIEAWTAIVKKRAFVRLSNYEQFEWRSKIYSVAFFTAFFNCSIVGSFGWYVAMNIFSSNPPRAY
jgi:hypothetical protein